MPYEAGSQASMNKYASIFDEPKETKPFDTGIDDGLQAPHGEENEPNLKYHTVGLVKNQDLTKN